MLREYFNRVEYGHIGGVQSEGATRNLRKDESLEHYNTSRLTLMWTISDEIKGKRKCRKGRKE
jgi:hypothetical protein